MPILATRDITTGYLKTTFSSLNTSRCDSSAMTCMTKPSCFSENSFIHIHPKCTILVLLMLNFLC